MKGEIMTKPYLLVDNGREVKKASTNPQDLAKKFVLNGVKDIKVLSPDKKVLITTCGCFISKCNDSKYLFNELVPAVIEAQSQVKQDNNQIKRATVAQQTTIRR